MIQRQEQISTLKTVISEQRSGWSEGTEPCQNLGEKPSRKRAQYIKRLGARMSSTYSKNIKFGVAGTEWVKWRRVWDEVREKSRGQIMDNLIGHGKKKKSGFYTEYGRKPRVVYKQKSDELWFKKSTLAARWRSDYRNTPEQSRRMLRKCRWENKSADQGRNNGDGQNLPS